MNSPTDFRTRREQELRRAFRPGTWPYLGFLLVTYYATSYASDYPKVFYAFAGLVLVISAARFAMVYPAIVSLRETSRWLQVLFGLLLLSGLVWGSFLAATIYLYREDALTSTLLLVCTAGTTAGAITAYSPKLGLLVWYLALLLVPSIAVEAAYGARAGKAMAAMSSLFLFFLVWQGRILNHRYREKARSQDLLEENARELERRVADRTAELLEAKESAEAANRSKGDFLANMSHEIRTPMHGVLGMTDLALTSECSPEMQDYLESIKMSAESLLQIINDVLDFSRIEARKLIIESRSFHLKACIEDIVKTLYLAAEQKHLQISLDIDAELPEMAEGDPLRIRQVLTNLIHNAIKFTDSGYVRVRAKRQETDEGLCMHFRVEDSGCGIAPDKQETIFESFTQADGSTTRRFGGSGLGLTISGQLVQLMGGKIWVESNFGEGSTFHVLLPIGGCTGVSKGLIAARAGG